MHFKELSEMPLIHLFSSPACNLKCDYCSNMFLRKSKVTEDFFQDTILLDLISKIPPTQFLLSGGEPLIHPGIEDLVILAGKYGHKVSLDTNFSIPIERLESLLSKWDPNTFGYVNISHHIVCGISNEYMLSRVKLLKDRGIRNFVKYIGVPEMLPQIEQNMKYFQDKGIGVCVTLCNGNWKGRALPQQYTLEELVKFLELVTLGSNALQFFSGIFSRGLPCRAGNDCIIINMRNDKKVIPCCHGGQFPLNIEKTFFYTKEKMKRILCPTIFCRGNLYFVFGINGVTDEIDRFETICNGNSSSLGLKKVLEFLYSISKKGYRIVDYNKLQEIENFIIRSGL